MKTCKECGETKALDEFHRDKAKKDGLRHVCKDCAKKQVKIWGAANKERVYAKNKAWAAANRERVMEYWRRYYLKKREELLACKREYNASTPEKNRAQGAVERAIRAGRMVRPDRCQRCGKLCKPHAHHPDYSRPLEVEWLCPSCHRQHHVDLAKKAA